MTPRIALLALALLAAACATARPASEGPAAAWVEMGPGGGALVRAVTEAASCPPLIVDGAAQPMQVRAASDGGSFPVTVCEAPLRPGASGVSAGGLALTAPVREPRRILVVGDTGCRMKAPSDFQACNDPAAWPFARVAARAAAWKPELVIHVGDFHYRESACPAGNAGCAGSPIGDTWAAWRADLFEPGAPLLRAAPWVMIRGNHESCSRAGQGWFRFLDPRPLPAACTDDTGPYLIPLGQIALAVIDSSPASDDSAPPADVARYAGQLDQLAAMKPAYTWLATHRPVWGVVGFNGQIGTGNATLQAAMRGRLPASLSLLLAGHIHLFEGLAFEPRRPPMLLVGNGGTALDQPVAQPLVGMTIDGATVTTGKTFGSFGYATLEPAGSGWRARVYDVNGAVVTECTVGSGTMTCTP